MASGLSFGILGGDMRQAYLARAIAAEGYAVCLACLEKADTGGLPRLSPEEMAASCGVVILPLPASRDGRTLNAPLSAERVELDDGFAELFEGKLVLGGMTEKLTASSPLWERADVRDYYDREELILGNAFLTAEGAVGLAVCEYEGAVNGSKCLVTGFGRIGKALCLCLKALSAKVYCAARRPEDLAAIRAMGCEAVRYEDLDGDFDLVFNTVPAPVLTARRLSKFRAGTPLFELASAPGGIDVQAAGRLSLRFIPAPSLPGRLSPKAAGELIKDTVFNMLSESGLFRP